MFELFPLELVEPCPRHKITQNGDDSLGGEYAENDAGQ